MQGLADGYFVLPYTIGDYLARTPPKPVDSQHPAFAEAEQAVRERMGRLLAINGDRTPDDFHKALGHLMWEYCGMSRNANGLRHAKKAIQELRAEFWQRVKVVGSGEDMNQNLEKAGRVADFLELGELMVDDALDRNESCGGHFREEYATEEGEAKRNDDDYAYVAAWEYQGDNQPEKLNKEPLHFENVKLTQRSYK